MCRKAQHHLTEGQHHFEQRENIISHFTAQMNDVALRTNDVMLRINGELQFCTMTPEKSTSSVAFLFYRVLAKRLWQLSGYSFEYGIEVLHIAVSYLLRYLRYAKLFIFQKLTRVLNTKRLNVETERLSG